MNEDDGLDLLLGEIPHATSSTSSSSLNLHHTLIRNSHHIIDHVYNKHAPYVAQEINSHGLCTDEILKYKYAFVSSPMSVSGFPSQFNDSSPSLVSGGVRSISNIESPFPPQYEEPKPHLVPGNRFLSDLMEANGSNLVDDFSLGVNFSKMFINGDQKGVSVFPNGCDRSPNGSMRMNFENCGESDHYWDGFSNHRGFIVSDARRALNFEREFVPSIAEMQHEQRTANLIRSEEWFSQYDIGNSALRPQFLRTGLLANDNLSMGFPISDESSISRRPFSGESLSYPLRNVMNLMEANDSFISPNMVPLMPRYYEKDLPHYQSPVPIERNALPLCEDSLIFQGESINYGMNRGYFGSRAQSKPQEKRPQLNGGLHVPAFQDNYRNNPKISLPFSIPSKFSSLSQSQIYIYHMAKDQNGCRFLQRMFEEGTSRDVQMIFNVIIVHVVELMMNPFGNYMMQKLLEVCNEEQRVHILLRVTEKSGELVRISLNTHGTRVVQKLVETIETRQGIHLVISALEHDFLSLIKDLNGNHVVQKCLQCFTDEDNKFIYVAAAKYCVEIARHQHGCCVLQRCISYSTGEHRENLVSEISANGLLLAQDAFGNYVIQFILEQIPSAVSKLTSHFEGNYVQLSMQKFSSHVVEKCLVVCNHEIRSKIIRELLSATYFDQLLKDPHANYVVQTALRISVGPLHNSLVDAIESYKAISRNSPYSKRIFSHKLLKK